VLAAEMGARAAVREMCMPIVLIIGLRGLWYGRSGGEGGKNGGKIGANDGKIGRNGGKKGMGMECGPRGDFLLLASSPSPSSLSATAAIGRYNAHEIARVGRVTDDAQNTCIHTSSMCGPLDDSRCLTAQQRPTIPDSKPDLPPGLAPGQKDIVELY